LDIKALVNRVKVSGQKSLDENLSKQILKEYGIPVVPETVASTRDDAVMAAGGFGFPVVLKGLGSKLLHKTEMGLVHLNLEGSDAVLKAADLISERAGEKLEGFLVQPQIKGKREFVAGLFRDKQFGPVVMFGLGGIFTEALSDVTFRVAPITERDAIRMLDEIKSKSLLNEFRGESKANRDMIVKTLTGLSRIGIDLPEIAEIDINPLIVTQTGDVCAVDAMMTLSDKKEKDDFLPPAGLGFLELFFYPKSIAFIGASSTIGKWGHLLYVQTAGNDFDGEIYLVNQRGGTIAGRKVYKSVSEVPGAVDLAVVTVPAAKVLELIPEFKKKGIKAMLVISSGFSELGMEGKEIETNVVKNARDAGIFIIGPNTMGISNFHSRLHCMGSRIRPVPGGTALVAQSGNMGVQLLAFAEQQGVGMRGFIGSGNEAMIGIEDYLDAFAADPLTKNIMMYLESIKNGRRFFEIARRVSKKKPIILLKGGQSKKGSKAAASHTGALTTDSRIFNTVCKQAGVVRVDHTMEMLDLGAAFSSFPLMKGNRIGIITLGGGWGVVATDLLSQYNLEVPELSDGLVTAFDKILPSYWSKSNPVDIVGERDFAIPLTVMEGFMKWDGCDAVLNMGILGRRFFISRLADMIKKTDPSYTEEEIESYRHSLFDFEKGLVEDIIKLMDKYKKPIIGVDLITGEGSQLVYKHEGSTYDSVFYPTIERAVKVISSMYEYSCYVRA
jgi:acyl-CoA synthetase (NDP forming)